MLVTGVLSGRSNLGEKLQFRERFSKSLGFGRRDKRERERTKRENIKETKIDLVSRNNLISSRNKMNDFLFEMG